MEHPVSDFHGQPEMLQRKSPAKTCGFLTYEPILFRSQTGKICTPCRRSYDLVM